MSDPALEPPDVLERASGGRFISLTRAGLGLREIHELHVHPFRTCPDCMGAGIGVLAVHIGGGIIATTGFITCRVCGGAKVVQYRCYN